MLDSGGHRNKVVSLAFTQDGKYLVSAGEDKVVRVWDWQQGKTVRIIRGRAGLGANGIIYTAALSPGDRWLAVSGAMAPGYGEKELSDAGDIRLFDFATGELKALLKGHTNVVGTIAFSPDGKEAVSGQGGDDGHMILWDIENRTIMRRLTTHRGPVNGVRYTLDGKRIVVTTDDSKLMLWSLADGSLVKDMTGHSAKVLALAVSPSNGVIASGDVLGEIRFWDGTTGNFIKTAGRACQGVGSLGFSPDGRLLLATCRDAPAGEYTQLVFDVATDKEITVYPNEKHGDAVLTSAFSPDGRLVATAGGSRFQIHVWDPLTGDTKAVLQGTGRSVWAAGFSSDGSRIGWGNTKSRNDPLNGFGPIEWALRLPSGGTKSATAGLGTPEPGTRRADWLRNQAVHAPWSLQLAIGDDRLPNILKILKDGELQATIIRNSRNGYHHPCVGFSPDGETIYSGGGIGILAAYKLDGTKILDFNGHEGTIWGLAVSADGKYLVSGADDQTVRLWNAKTGELLVSLFHGTDGEWVMWTPQGYFTGSPGGEKIIGWQINKGPDRAADFVNGNQLRQHFYRPDIVERAILLASAKAAMGGSRDVAFSLDDLTKRQPPVFEITSPKAGAHVNGTSAGLSLKLEANQEPVEAIEVLVNGRQATTPEMRGIGARATGPGGPNITVPLDAGENHVRLLVRNAVGRTEQEFVLYRDEAETTDKRGVLYVLAIGADNYSQLPKRCGPDGNEPCNLRFAGQDAREFRDIVVEGSKSLFRDRQTMLLAAGGDKVPTKTNIEDALDFFKNATTDDTVVLFVAGHGVTDSSTSDYLFLPENAEPSGSDWRKSTVVPWYQFEYALQTSHGRRLMFVDTCHAGGAHNPRLLNNAADSNIIVFSATDPDTLSYEFEEIGHGAFTYAVIQGLKGEARSRNGSVTVLGLGNYVAEWVTSKTRDQQQPMFSMSRTKNFTLALPPQATPAAQPASPGGAN